MRNLFRLIEKYNFILVFLILEVVSFYIIFKNNQKQGDFFIATSNHVSASLLEISGDIKNYFSLKKANDDLAIENNLLKAQLSNMEEKFSRLDIPILSDSAISPFSYNFNFAKVVNNSINRSDNYLTINIGQRDSIKSEMGVVSAHGVVGITYNVSSNYSTVVSILNSKFKVSAKLVDSNNFGTLTWDGKSSRFAVLSEIPAHAKLSKGAAIVTSGYSNIFPENILIGTIEDFEIDEGEGFFNIKVRLSVDFSNLVYVSVVEKISAEEQKQIENQNNR